MMIELSKVVEATLKLERIMDAYRIISAFADSSLLSREKSFVLENYIGRDMLLHLTILIIITVEYNVLQLWCSGKLVYKVFIWPSAFERKKIH